VTTNRPRYRIAKGSKVRCAYCKGFFTYIGKSHTYCNRTCYTAARNKSGLAEVSSRRTRALYYLEHNGLATPDELAKYLNVHRNDVYSVLSRALKGGEIERVIGLTQKGRDQLALLRRRELAKGNTLPDPDTGTYASSAP
jgi:predicted HTH transcriptional regulator